MRLTRHAILRIVFTTAAFWGTPWTGHAQMGMMQDALSRPRGPAHAAPPNLPRGWVPPVVFTSAELPMRVPGPKSLFESPQFTPPPLSTTAVGRIQQVPEHVAWDLPNAGPTSARATRIQAGPVPTNGLPESDSSWPPAFYPPGMQPAEPVSAPPKMAPAMPPGPGSHFATIPSSTQPSSTQPSSTDGSHGRADIRLSQVPPDQSSGGATAAGTATTLPAATVDSHRGPAAESPTSVAFDKIAPPGSSDSNATSQRKSERVADAGGAADSDGEAQSPAAHAASIYPPSLVPSILAAGEHEADAGGFPLGCFESSCGPPHQPVDPYAFCPGPNFDGLPYDPDGELQVYEGKWCVPSQRPLIELGRGLYRTGELPPAWTALGETNPVMPTFLMFGDYRTAIAYNQQDRRQAAVWAQRLNLDFDLRLTGTERIHAFWGPLDQGDNFTRAEAVDNKLDFFQEFDNDIDTLFFEGDLGYIWGGMTDRWAPFDLPFVAGKFPLLFQNGIWVNDAIEGFAFTPCLSRNSRIFDISNYDVTFFFGFDDVDSGAFDFNDNTADIYGVTSFIEAAHGYFEIGYAFLNDRSRQGLSYHNMAFAYSRRYLHRLSNSIRVIVNSGQDPNVGAQTADGTLLLIENALISSNPNYLVPYLNMFAGFGSVQRAAGQGNILLNTGINFETDFLTGYPTLDATANNTWGGAMGVNLLGSAYSWQLLTEIAMVQTFGDRATRNAPGDQYACGVRYQVPLNYAWLLRLDAMHGLMDNTDDITGVRAELRWKF